MPILSDRNCSPTLVQLKSLESSITSRTETLSAELCTKTNSSNWLGFSLTEVGSVLLGCKNLWAVGIPQRRHFLDCCGACISYMCHFLMTLLVMSVVAKFPQYCLHFLQLYFGTIHPLAGVHLTNWQCWLQVLVLAISQAILSTHYPVWLTIYRSAVWRTIHKPSCG